MNAEYINIDATIKQAESTNAYVVPSYNDNGNRIARHKDFLDAMIISMEKYGTRYRGTDAELAQHEFELKLLAGEVRLIDQDRNLDPDL